ncbi:MAG: hypothetical protein ACI9MC_003134, partial [Kiritimatiellia bacterium]
VAAGTALFLLPEGDDIANLAIKAAMSVTLIAGAGFSALSAWQWSKMAPQAVKKEVFDGLIADEQQELAGAPRAGDILHYDADHATAEPVYRPR